VSWSWSPIQNCDPDTGPNTTFFYTPTSPDTNTFTVSVQANCYDCVSGNSSLSTSVTITVIATPFSSVSITSQPVSQIACAGGSVTSSVGATGGSLTYQWRRNGVNLTNGGSISGATSATLTISNFNPNGAICQSVPAANGNGTPFGAVVEGRTYSNQASGCVRRNSEATLNPDPDGNQYNDTNCTDFAQKHLAYSGFVCPDLTAFSLVGKIGSTCIQLGSSGSFQAPESGILNLYCNDDFYNDNSGSWDVRVWGIVESYDVIVTGCNSATSSVATVAISTACDGIPDWWRQQYFGSGTTTNNTSCASCDPDGDGYTNLQEYHFGTDPTNTISHTEAIPPNLVAWWKLDEGAGTITADNSGNGHDGALLGTPGPQWVAGMESNAVAFSGSGTDYIQASGDGSFLGLTNQLTTSLWVSNAVGATGTLLSKFDANTLTGSFSLSLSNGYAQFELFLGGDPVTLVASTAIPDGGWHHLAATYDGTAMKLYLDGGSNAVAGIAGTVDVVEADVLLGRDARGAPFAGALDDARVYNRALSAAEVQALWDDGDSDGDGIPNGWELAHGLNPTDPSDANQPSTNPWAHGLTNLQVYQNPSVLIADNYSTLNDGIPDWWKVKYGFFLTDPSVAGGDPDGDGVNNLTEFLQGRDPTKGAVADTSGLVNLKVFTPLE
jgi:hypothetical protein